MTFLPIKGVTEIIIEMLSLTEKCAICVGRFDNNDHSRDQRGGEEEEKREKRRKRKAEGNEVRRNGEKMKGKRKNKEVTKERNREL